MKRLIGIWTGLWLLVLMIPASWAFAKGPADKITITGSGLANPVEITDPKALDQFDPWRGKFIDWSRGTVSTLPRDVQTYEVFITVNNEDGQPGRIYTFRYYLDPSGQGGYVYLPGPGEKGYEGNIGTIIRGDGWYYGSAEWNALMERVLKVNPTLPISSELTSMTDLVTQNPWIVALGIILMIGSITVLIRRVREAPA